MLDIILDIVLTIFVMTCLAFVGGVIYGMIGEYIESRKKAKKSKHEEYWKRYGEYMMKAKKAREGTKVK